MKLFRALRFLICHFSFLICLSQPPGEWTWMNGDTLANANTVYGTLGIPAPANHPASVYGPVSWTDKQGNFWLYGGVGSGIFGAPDYGDLWKYSPVINQWTWVKGPGTANQLPVYGTLGVAAASNDPGGRGYGSLTWVDTTGDLWLFGGWLTSMGCYSDLWKYNIATNMWTWMKGTGGFNYSGNYGTPGVPSPTNAPPGLNECTAGWVDNANNLWFFGGLPITSIALDDVWKYNIASNEWTWMKGAGNNGDTAVYGTRGVAASTNTPGGRMVYSKWKTSNTSFWIFGGGYVSPYNYYDDLWNYDVLTNNWTWFSGTSVLNDSAHLDSVPCHYSVLNHPGAIYENRACWTDAQNNFLMYAGFATSGVYNTFWKYRPSTNEWTEISSGTFNPIYGTMGVSAPANSPGGRAGTPSFKDLSGNLWLFGGAANTGVSCEMWRYVPDSCGAVNLPQANFTPSDSVVCPGTCIDFPNFSSNATQYQWLFPGAMPVSDTSANPTHICYPAQGTFTATLIASNGSGNDTLNTTITVYPPPQVNIIADTTVICSNDSAQICATAGFVSYLWNMGNTSVCIEAQLAGNYYVTVTDNNGCTAESNHLSLTVHTSPAVSISVNGDTLTAYNATTYQWYFNGNPIPGANQQSYIATQGGNYTVSVTDSNGCAAVSTPVVISGISPRTLGEGQRVRIFPNPNATNTWQLEVSKELLGSYIEIFDAQGRIVFKSLILNPESLIELNVEGGIYLLRVSSANNIITRKLIKL